VGLPAVLTEMIVLLSDSPLALPLSMNRCCEPPGFGLRQSSGAFRWPRAFKRSKTLARQTNPSQVQGFKARSLSGNSLPVEGRGNQNVATFIAMLIGLTGVFCSMMIYHDTQRVLWNWRRSVPLFFGTVALLGLSAVLIANPSNGASCAALAVAVVAKLAVEISVLRHVTNRDLTSLKKSARLVTHQFRRVAFARLACLMAGGIGLPLLLSTGAFTFAPATIGWCAFALVAAGELLERLLFFRAVDAPKMPGGFAA
jgi:hypothetical protein